MSTLAAKSSMLKVPLGAYAAVWGCGFLSMAAMPFIMGTLITELEMDSGSAGLIGTAELIVTALVAFSLTPLMASLPRRNLAILGAGIAIVGHALSAYLIDSSLLIAARAVAGAGAGIAMAAGQAAVAGTANVSTSYARMMVFMALGTSLFLVLIGQAAEAYPARGVFAFQAVWVLMMLPIMLFLPRVDPVPEDGRPGNGHASPPVKIGLAGLAVSVVFLYSVTDISVWSISELRAASFGFNVSHVGVILGIALLVGVVGGASAEVLGKWWGHNKSLYLGLILSALCALLITMGPGASIYVSGQILYGAVYTFTLPFLYGLAGDMDKHGRVMVAASASALVGAAVGPLYGGFLYQLSGFSTIGLSYTAIIVVVSLLSALFMSRAEVDKAQQQGSASQVAAD